MPHLASERTPDIPNTPDDIPNQDGQNNKDNSDNKENGDNTDHTADNSVENSIKKYVNEAGTTIGERYLVPEGFTRTKVDEGSFGEFLRNQKLKPYGEKALYYNGREKPSEGVYDSVLDVDIGGRDLHQCADAIMLLRAEYLYQNGRYDDISFHFVSGFLAEYKKWMEGYRIKVQGNNASYYKADSPSNTYNDFRRFMDIVMSYSSTLSLEKELKPVLISDIMIGDVFIVGGSPGHAVIVVDMAENHLGEKIFLLAQSYMPAQQTQILINPMDESISPWYSLKNKDSLVTPQWKFQLDQLKRFDDK
ncbi:MAG TPA: DUF4846 domain-containing protein [Clostridiales bacterium]|nr:DUF4846 domain-containing protein [Clostridiales bacterium]